MLYEVENSICRRRRGGDAGGLLEVQRRVLVSSLKTISMLQGEGRREPLQM